MVIPKTCSSRYPNQATDYVLLPGLSMGHIHLFHSHPIAIYACPVPWDVSHPHGQACLLPFIKFFGISGQNFLLQ